MKWAFAKLVKDRRPLYFVKIDDSRHVIESFVDAGTLLVSSMFGINREALVIVTEDQKSYAVKLIDHLYDASCEADNFETNSDLYEKKFGKMKVDFGGGK